MTHWTYASLDLRLEVLEMTLDFDLGQPTKGTWCSVMTMMCTHARARTHESMRADYTCRVFYSPHIAPGGQPKPPFFLSFIWACCRFFLLHCPVLLHLSPPVIPLPVPPHTAAVQVQLRLWWGESRRRLHARTAASDALKIHSDPAVFKRLPLRHKRTHL